MKPSIISLDIDVNQIRGIGFGYKGKKLVVQHLATKDIPSAEGGKVPSISELIKSLSKELGIKAKNARIAVPGSSAFVRQVTVLAGGKRRFEDMIRLEASQAIPFDLKEVAWDYFVIPSQAKDMSPPALQSRKKSRLEEIEVVLVAVKKDLVESRAEEVRKAGFEISEIDIRPLTLWRAAKVQSAFDCNAHTLILGIGSRVTDLVISHRGSLWTRSIPLGIAHVAPSKEEADGFVEELKGAINFYFMERTSAGAEGGDKIDAAFISISTPLPDTLRNAVENRVCPKTFLIDPFYQVETTPLVEERIKREMVEGRASAFACAMGLALRGIADGGAEINLFKNARALRAKTRQVRTYTVLSFFVALMVVVMSTFPLSNPLEEETLRLRKLERTLAEAKEFRPKIERIEAEREALAKRVGVLYGVTINRRIWLHVLRELNQSLPKNVWITELDAKGRLLSKEGVSSLTLKGCGASYETINDFVGKLKLSPVLSEVKPVSSSVIRKEDGSEFVEFTVTVNVDSKEVGVNKGDRMMGKADES